MDLPALLAGLLRILLWQAACAGAQGASAVQLLPPPTLSWSPPGSFVSRVKPIHFNCSPPEGQQAEWFYFHQLKEEGQWTKQTEQEQNHFVVPTSGLKANETFACSYLGKNRKGRRACSERSNQAMIIIADPTPLPSLSADPPGPLYRPGEMVTLRCSAPRDAPGMRFEFSHLGEGLTSEKSPAHDGSSRFSLTTTKETSGWYSCRYLASDTERLSKSSRAVKVSVADPPPAPVLLVDPPSGKVPEGAPLTLHCSASGNQTDRRFHFYQDGAERPPAGNMALRSSGEAGGGSPDASISIPQAGASHTGRYACSYVEKHNLSWLHSSRSPEVDVTVFVPVSPLPVLDYARWTLPLLILSIPLSFCCSSRRKAARIRRRAQHPGEGRPGEAPTCTAQALYANT